MSNIIAIIFIVLLIISMICGAAFVTSFIAMFCWNHAIVPLFHAPQASFWEMLCFIVLIGILFSGFRITKN